MNYNNNKFLLSTINYYSKQRVRFKFDQAKLEDHREIKQIQKFFI